MYIHPVLTFYLHNKDYQIEKVLVLQKKKENDFHLSKLPKIVDNFMKKDLVTKIFLL